MSTEHSNGELHVELSSGNVFADLGLPNADELLRKSDLVIKLQHEIEQLGLSHQVAADRIGITEKQLKDLIYKNFGEISDSKFMDYLKKLRSNQETQMLGPRVQ